MRVILRMESGIRQILLVESGILGFGIRNTALRIGIPTNYWNPESKFYWLESSTRIPESKTVLILLHGAIKRLKKNLKKYRPWPGVERTHPELLNKINWNDVC